MLRTFLEGEERYEEYQKVEELLKRNSFIRTISTDFTVVYFLPGRSHLISQSVGIRLRICWTALARLA